VCLTIPGKILSIKDGIATVKSSTETAQIDLSFVLDAKPGDWILFATNRAVKVISESDAKEIISLLEDHYSKVDVSKLPLKFKKIIFKVRSQHSNNSSNKMRSSRQARTIIDDSVLTKDEIIYLLNLKGKENLETLFAEANSIRKERIEDFVCIHGIIEFSNFCKNDCLYCGLRKSKKTSRYRMTCREIENVAKKSVEDDSYKLLVLQSGEDDHYLDDDLIKIILNIRAKMKVFIFLSVGERSKSFYDRAKKAGASGALIRFESSDNDFYAKIRPGHKLQDRLDIINHLRDTGYYVATGSLFGLPGQTLEQIADDLLTIKKLGIPMISSGPWLAASGTPLAGKNFQFPISNFQSNPKYQISKKISNFTWQNTIYNIQNTTERLELALKYIAVARFMMPEIKIPVTTALETLDPDGRHKALLAGANALMFNLTPEKYCEKYSIYDNKYREREKVWQKYGLFSGEESWEMLEERLML